MSNATRPSSGSLSGSASSLIPPGTMQRPVRESPTVADVTANMAIRAFNAAGVRPFVLTPERREAIRRAADDQPLIPASLFRSSAGLAKVAKSHLADGTESRERPTTAWVDPEVARLAIDAVLKAKCRRALVKVFIEAGEDPDEGRISSLADDMAAEMHLEAIGGDLYPVSNEDPSGDRP